LHFRKKTLLITWIEDDIHWRSQLFRLLSGESRDSRHPQRTRTRRSKWDEIARRRTFCLLPKVDDLGRREARLVEHMVEVATEVSWFWRSGKIVVYDRNISKVRRSK
jgi:hypothetical protein